MALHLDHEVLRLALRDPFRIARSDHDAGHAVTTVIVRLRDDRFPGLVGTGEGFPDRFYGETVETVAAVLPLLIGAIGEPDASTAGLVAADAAMDRVIAHNGAAKCALDIALHDLFGQVLGQPLATLLDTAGPIPPTDFTLGIDAPDVVAQRATRAARFPALKIKLGGAADLATLEAVRAVYGGALRVDANTGWQPDEAVELIPELERLAVELIEQPFPADRLDQLGWLQERSSLPIVADESAVTIRDLRGLVGVVAGVNVKLAKCGGVGPARAMLAAARELGFRTFLGCMEETSVGIAASVAVASLADWVDLDGSLLLADDPFDGLVLDDDCRWQAPAGPRPGDPASPHLRPGTASGRPRVERPFVCGQVRGRVGGQTPFIHGPAGPTIADHRAGESSPGGTEPAAGETPRGIPRSADPADRRVDGSCCHATGSTGGSAIDGSQQRHCPSRHRAARHRGRSVGVRSLLPSTQARRLAGAL